MECEMKDRTDESVCYDLYGLRLVLCPPGLTVHGPCSMRRSDMGMDAWIAAYLKRALSWMNLETELSDWHQHKESLLFSHPGPPLSLRHIQEDSPDTEHRTAGYAPQHERRGLRRMSGLEEPEKLRER
jgi:hypothetical protein